jgi:hypothetical protein
LVERNLAKVEVASSSLVSRSKSKASAVAGVFSFPDAMFDAETCKYRPDVVDFAGFPVRTWG